MEVRAFAGLVGLAVVACGGRAPAVAPAPASGASSAAREQSAPRDPCGEEAGLLIEPVAPIAARWQGATVVGGQGPVVVRWCGEGAVTVESVTLVMPAAAGAAEWPSYVRSPDPALAVLSRGESLTEQLQAPADPAHLAVVVLAVDGDGVEHTARGPVESVEDPTRVAQRRECDAVHGEWAPHGMARIESCDRPTSDAGQRCTSDLDCEGPCIETGSEPLGAARPEGVDIPACAVGQEPRLLVGECFHHTLRFGCHALLETTTIECVAPSAARRSRRVCVD